MAARPPISSPTRRPPKRISSWCQRSWSKRLMAIEIAIETPLQDDVRTLVEELNATLLELTPPEHCYHMTVEQMADKDTTVFIARDDGLAIGCGALKRHAGAVGEVKRMYTRPSHRGRKIGAMIVERVEALARDEGMERLVLET